MVHPGLAFASSERDLDFAPWALEEESSLFFFLSFHSLIRILPLVAL